MEKLFIEGTEYSPTIEFNKEEEIFRIYGRSLPENGEQFFSPVLGWLDDYLLDPNPKTKFEFHLEQLNISSSKMLLFVLYKLKDLKDAGLKVSILWYHNDQDSDILEVGEDYEFMVDLPFRFKTGQPEFCLVPVAAAV